LFDYFSVEKLGQSGPPRWRAVVFFNRIIIIGTCIRGKIGIAVGIGIGIVVCKKMFSIPTPKALYRETVRSTGLLTIHFATVTSPASFAAVASPIGEAGMPRRGHEGISNPDISRVIPGVIVYSKSTLF
jgi:hypothetical protein